MSVPLAAITTEDGATDAVAAADAGWLLRVPPARLGVVVAGLLLTVLMAQQALLGRVPFDAGGNWKDLRIAIVHCLLAGYVPAAVAAVAQGAARTLAALRPHLAWTAADEARERTQVLGAGAAAAGVAGMALSVFGPALTEPGRSVWSWWHPAAWAPEVAWHRVLGLPVGFCFGVFAFAVFLSSARLSRLSARVRVDLFDLSNLAPVTRQGLANGLAAIGSFALFALISVNFGFTPLLVVMVAMSTVIVTAAVMLPLRGAHRQIRAAKQAELAWCAAAVEQERRAVRREDLPGAGGRFADLLAYQTLVERVREWPFDTGTLTRVALYSVIPLGSWVASTIVQHVVERYLFRR